MHCRNARYSVLRNLTTEPLKESHSFNNKSSVSDLKHVTAKSNQSEEKTARFISLVAILGAIKLFSCIHVIGKDGGFPCNKDEAKKL